jgi:hypothetical protein
MQPRKAKREPDIADAAEKTGLLIRGLQSRLLEGSSAAEEQSGDTITLEKQLQEYFADWPSEENPGAGPLNRIRNRVIDGVAERILHGWQQGGKTPSENEVIDRLIDGVLEILITDGNRRERRAGGFPTRPLAATQLSGDQTPA